ncbi:MAG: nucleoside hydrolase [Brevinema sp.]
MLKNIWIDTDPGIDDSIGILWALKKEQTLGWKIHGLSTVNGNSPLDQVTINACALLEHAGRTDIPVYKGFSHAFIQEEIHAEQIHGKHLGPFDPKPIKKAERESYIIGIKKCIDSLPKGEKLSLITIGPLTNIGGLFRLYPDIMDKIECIYMMGGGSSGNITPYAEFNIYVDPEAADIVFKSGRPIIMSGTDLCENKAYMTYDELDKYKNHVSDQWIKAFLEFWNTNRINNEKRFIYDPTVFVYLAYPELFTSYKAHIEIQLALPARGMTLISTKVVDDQKPVLFNASVLEDCKRKEFLNTLFGIF